MRTNVIPKQSRWNGYVAIEREERPCVVPIALARRISKHDNDLLIITCPYCGREHTHGACGRGSPFGAGDGHRVAHCVNGASNSGYILREVPA